MILLSGSISIFLGFFIAISLKLLINNLAKERKKNILSANTYEVHKYKMNFLTFDHYSYLNHRPILVSSEKINRQI
jgi:hypothetical protein